MLRLTIQTAAIVLLGLTLSIRSVSAFPPILPKAGGLQIKIPVGLERWLPEAPPNPDTILTGGAGWFSCNNLTLDDINVGYPSMGFRAFDVEVEQWGDDPRFSAVFIQNAGKYEVGHSFVMIGTEEEVRFHLTQGQYQNYRMMDLEVHQYHVSPPPVKKNVPQEITTFEPEICALLVTNEGNQYTPEWDFVVYATPIELMIFEDSFEGNMRIIDNEISLAASIESSNDSESLQKVVYSQIMVSDDGIEHVETSVFQFSSAIELMLLQNQGWQLIDSERNIPLMTTHYSDWYGTFTGVFVQKPNLVEFYPDVDTYSLFPSYTNDDKRMIDLELIPADGAVPFTVDELYLQY